MKIGISCRYTFAQKSARSIVYANTLFSILKEIKPSTTGTGLLGQGTWSEPYQPSAIGHWYKLSQLKLTGNPIFIRVGTRLIARWGNNAGKFKNYCTDVTEDANDAARLALAQATQGGVMNEDHVAAWGDFYAEMDGHSPLPAYTKKALRVMSIETMTDQYAANQSRLLLSGEPTAGANCPELACSLCSLFISEASRAPETFAVAIMLLDLIETSTTYGLGGEKMYTWRSMLSHDTTHIPGRSAGEKIQGKHPMAARGSAEYARKMDIESTTPNMVMARSVSILSVWLAHYLKKKHAEYEYFIVKGIKGEVVKQVLVRESEHDKGHFMLKTACRKAVQDRVGDFTVKIGGTTVQYENIGGNRV
jgi:hypothetical protein